MTTISQTTLSNVFFNENEWIANTISLKFALNDHDRSVYNSVYVDCLKERLILRSECRWYENDFHRISHMFMVSKMASWHGNGWHVTGPLWGESIGHLSIPQAKGRQLASILMCINILVSHEDVMKWKHFPRSWPFVVRGIHRSPHKGQWRGTLMCSLICAWINGWVSNREAADLRRHRAH